MRSPAGLSEKYDQIVLTPNTPGQLAAAAVACKRAARDAEELALFLRMLGLMR